MKAVRVENGIVVAHLEVPTLDCFEGISLIKAPDEVGVGWAFDGVSFIMPQSELEAIRRRTRDAIDSHIAQIYISFQQFSIARAEREKAARAFKAAGYQGDASVWITKFAENTKITAIAATDIIIAKADAQAKAIESLDALRMDKQLITDSSTAAQAREKRDEVIRLANDIAATIT
jgi:hypothetical protein